MTDFDPIKAMREEVAGLADVHRVVLTHAHDSERKLSETEADHNAFLKMEAFMRQLLADARAKLKAMEDENAKG